MNPLKLDESLTRVFLVEDNEDTRFLLAYLLEEAGFAVQTAGTMAAALREFPQSGSDVLISDIGLADGNGCELLRQLHDGGMSPFAIAMSGYGALSDIAASREAGFSHHLVKPVELHELERLLRELGPGLQTTD